jgi:anti-sigma regulatory factor (Ser/Thr protein kinase)
VDRQNVKDTIRHLAGSPYGVSSAEIREVTGLTRQAIHYHVRELVARGELYSSGRGRAVRYHANIVFHETFETAGLQEHLVWRQMEESVPAIKILPPEAKGVAQYVLTEMVNNAIDHSQSESVEVDVSVSHLGYIPFGVVDHGVGVFEHVRDRFALPSLVDAALHLSKGKVTTQPEAHTGEGIFFSSQAVAVFTLEANETTYEVNNLAEDIAIGASRVTRGTRVRWTLDPSSETTMADVFAEYTTDYEFDRTTFRVALLQHGTTFVSRSEAKRLASGLERFSEVTLDFAGVDLVGQGFIDELFRVWASGHPGTRLVPMNMNPVVAAMVARSA